MAEPALDTPFDLRELEIFIAVCRAESMSAAAQTLGLTQPAVSLAVSELERKIAARLFDRAVRPIALTPAGVVLRERAAALLADAREIPALLLETSKGKVPLIRLGLVDSVSRALSVEAARFLKRRADSVSMLSGLTAAHASALLTRRLDILIGVDDLEEAPGLERFELLQETYLLLLPPGAARVATVADLKRLAQKWPLVRFSARSRTGIEIERHLRRLGVEPAKQLEFDSPFGVTATVAAGNAFAITTRLCLYEAQLPPESVVAVPLPGPQISRTLTLVARHREFGNVPKDLAAAMRKTLRDLDAGHAQSPK